MDPTLIPKINDCAIRAFRGTADKDYIHARMAYRAALIPQFHWSSLHALEKYAKCITILARVRRPKKHVGHEVLRSLDLLSSAIDIEISDQTEKFLKKLEKFNAKYRYLEVSWSIHEHEIIFLDRAVWELRRFCNSAIYDYSTESEPVPLICSEISELDNSKDRTVKNTFIEDGYLENVLEDKKHPARDSLTWRNFYYAKVKRKQVTLPSYLLAENSPFYLHPEIVGEVNKYVFVPKHVINGYKTR